jgi:hypothetical protein
MPNDFELVDADLGPDTNKDIEKWLHEKLENYLSSHADRNKTKIPRWRRLYYGKPQSEKSNTPWPDSSNVVVQIIGDRVDTMTARILGFIFATSPLWHFMYPAATDSPKDAERKRQILSEFMDHMGYETSQLNLYPTYGVWCTEHAYVGSAFVGINWRECMEVTKVSNTSVKEGKKARRYDEEEIYSGPEVVNLDPEDVMMDVQAASVEKSRLVTKRCKLTRYELEERAFDGFYDKAAVESIIDKPDRYGLDANAAKEARRKGVAPTMSDVNAEWDVYECYFPWMRTMKGETRKLRLVYSYHYSSRTVLRRVFNPIPKNRTPIVRAKFGYRTSGAYGFGLADMLDGYQWGASKVHNNRVNNSTLANTRFWRIDPSATQIGSQVEIFPNAAITASKDQIEAIQMSDVYQSSFDNERVYQELADQRAGIAPAVTGSGAGGPTKGKGNPYSSLGTLAAMQEGNHRTNLATSDFRHAHVDVGSICTSLYDRFGTSGKEQMFGKDSKFLLAALKEFGQGKSLIPIRSTNAAVNREVEKQNDMLMVGLVQRHYTAQAQLMQALQNQMIPENAKAYFTKVIESADRMMQRILRDFGYDQPKDFIPDAGEGLQPNAQPQAPQAGPDAAAIAARQSMGGPVVPPGAGQGNAGVPGMGGPQGRPQ